MTFRLFIDECLSPELVGMAVKAGFEATCSRDRGLLGRKDWDLVTYVVDHDMTMVTNNSRDFRGGGPVEPGGLFAHQEIHAGLICINSESDMDLEREQRLFGHLLIELSRHQDLVNQALDLFEDEEGKRHHALRNSDHLATAKSFKRTQE